MRNYGAGDILEIAPEGGGETLLLPFTKAVAVEIDFGRRRIVIVPPDEIDGGHEPEQRRRDVRRHHPHPVPGNVPGPARPQSSPATRWRAGLWSLEARDIREHGLGRHRAVDDTPAGGGPGMVMRADVLAASLDAALGPTTRARG